MKIEKNASTAQMASFRAGGNCDELITVESKEDLKEAVIYAKESRKPFMYLGNCSNVLIRDGGYKGIIIRGSKEFEKIKVDGKKIIAGSAALLSAVSKTALEAELAGFEFASGIPGSVGGAMFMNAGAYGGEMKDIVEELRVFDADSMEFKTLKGSEMQFDYRCSRLHEKNEIVTEVVFVLEKGNRETIAEKIKDFRERRNLKQPVQYPSAGSTFKRPEGYFAGKLIEDAGLKGRSVGGAEVSEKHAGFIINRGGATAGEIEELMEIVTATVESKFGVTLEPEVRIIGSK